MGNSNGNCMGDAGTADRKKKVLVPSIHNPMAIPTIPISHVLTSIHDARLQALLCSAGTRGYCALKEMLQSGSGDGGGSTVLLESGDVRGMIAPRVHYTTTSRCCYLYSFPDREKQVFKHWDMVIPTVAGITIYSNLATLPPFVLFGRDSLTSVTLGSMPKLKSIQDHFLSGCSDMKTLDMSALNGTTNTPSSSSSLDHVGFYFLKDCSSLLKLDLSPLSNLRVIDPSFLAGCKSLKELDLSPLSKVTVIHGSFLNGCSGLTTIDLTPLSQITKVASSFLAGCSGLTSIDLGPLSKVTEVDSWFLENCSGLSTIDLSPFSQCVELKSSFLSGCSSLLMPDLDLNTMMPHLTKIDAAGFLRRCEGVSIVKVPAQLLASPPSGWEVDGSEQQWKRMS